MNMFWILLTKMGVNLKNMSQRAGDLYLNPARCKKIRENQQNHGMEALFVILKTDHFMYQILSLIQIPNSNSNQICFMDTVARMYSIKERISEQEKKVETDQAQLPLILYNQFIRATK